ncbi:MAG TPA: class I SAM-dependent methyltransferase [Stellaceae bacterium]|nr:class I SAM-dependent methyltransferase [Stellaceae bacterium]
MTPSTPCPVCGARHAELFFQHAAGPLPRCLDCGMIWLDPPPSRATVDALYTDAYAGATTGYFSKVERKLSRSAGRVRHMLRVLGSGASGGGVAGGGVAGGGAVGKSFLDVGANGGFMSEAARRAGFEVTGVEPDGQSVAYAREHYPGIRFLNAFIEDAELPPDSFDAVYCSEVIEHSFDVNAFVAAIARAMKPGGIFYVTTPDINHWRRPKDVTKWDAFGPPSHCLYFSPANLARLLDRHGLDTIVKRIAFKPGIKLIARKRATA